MSVKRQSSWMEALKRRKGRRDFPQPVQQRQIGGTMKCADEEGFVQGETQSSPSVPGLRKCEKSPKRRESGGESMKIL